MHSLVSTEICFNVQSTNLQDRHASCPYGIQILCAYVYVCEREKQAWSLQKMEFLKNGAIIGNDQGRFFEVD